jgi:hypothetical protein
MIFNFFARFDVTKGAKLPPILTLGVLYGGCYLPSLSTQSID